jgi:uncharacterized protein YndB with AHSA1/START domain
MFVSIAIVIGVLLVGLLGYAATRPNTFQVQRKQGIQAPPDRIFALIEDYRKWAAWSPYEKLDPTMKKTFSGADSGKGAVYNWAGNSKAGEGRMEIVDAVSPRLVKIKLDFLKPFEGHNTAEFTLDAKGSATDVTWAMYGPQPFMFKVMSIFVNMDKMLGKDFEAGLSNLKAIAEGKAVAATTGAQ